MMNSLLRVSLACGALVLACGCGQNAGAQGTLETRMLPNGIRLAVVHFPSSKNASLLTFLPLGLANDGPGQAQWSHLIEHLVIRSTIPDDLRQANAETAADHMRLDFYGTTDNWKEGLAHHKRWLEGVPFTEASLAAEKPKVVAECDFTAQNFATHKFAVAAWAQGYRHGRKQADVKGDVLRAELKAVQACRDERLAVLDKTTVCLVGGVDAKTFFAEAEKQLGGITSRAKVPARTKPAAGNLDVTWDLDARHLVLTWPLPDASQEDYAALLAAAQWQTVQFCSDAELKTQTGMVFAGADLSTPEGNFLYVSASLRPGATFAAVEKRLRACVNQWATAPSEQIALFSKTAALSLTYVPDPAAFIAQAPAGVSPAMIECNVGLQACMNLHRYGGQREALAGMLGSVTTAKVRQAASRYLSEQKCSVCTIHPAQEAEKK